MPTTRYAAGLLTTGQPDFDGDLKKTSGVSYIVRPCRIVRRCTAIATSYALRFHPRAAEMIDQERALTDVSRLTMSRGVENQDATTSEKRTAV